MKLLFALFISLVPVATWSQWMDPISPTWPSAGWTGDTAFFTLNANGQLQSQFPGLGFYQLIHDLPPTPNDMELSCFYRQNFSGSSNNFGRILIYESGQPDSVGHNNNAGVKGWVIQWGNTGSSDEIQIFWNDGSIWEQMADTFFIANGVYGQIKMIQDSMVHFFFQDNDSAQFYPLLHTALPLNFQPMHVCLQAQCTSSNGYNFYCDDFYCGSPYIPIPLMSTGKRSVVFNEVLADPEPNTAEGRSEFIELYNNTTDSIWLKDWILYNTTTAHPLPEKFIAPNAFILLCHMNDTALYEAETWGLESFSALTNTGDSLTLCSPDGSIVDVFQYNLNLFDNEDKSNGGWSLEQINPQLPCSGDFNWSVCESNSGATPGRNNSIHDTLFLPPTPSITDWGIDTDQSLYLWSNLPWEQDSIQLQLNDAFMLLSCSASYDSLIIPLPEYNDGDILQIDSVQFCNTSIPISIQLQLPVITEVDVPSIVFNELLYHPLEEESPFVELYNKSQENISLDHLWIENQSGSVYSIQQHHHFIRAENRIALTENNLIGECSNENIHLVKQLPYMTISEGELHLGYTFFKLDTLIYHDSLHHPNLWETQGLSLERVEGGLIQEAWLTAGKHSGGKTPGCPNSQQWNYHLDEIQFQITPEYFSPNNDGYNDVIAFSYRGDQPGVESSLKILTKDGHVIKTLSNGEWQGQQAQWTWDGTNETQELCPVGMFFALLEVWTGQSTHPLKGIKSFVLSP
jgi:Lamin Tail Domain/CHU_C Type IX secretion signal domain